MKSLCISLALILTCVLSACGGGGAPLSVTLSPSGSQNVVAGQAVNFTATVANDSKTAGVSWSLSGAGTLSAQTTTSVTYTAPSPIAANGTATLLATSVTDTTKTATVTINLQAVSIAVTPSAAQTDEQGQSTSVSATVSNDPQNKGVTWSLTGAGTLTGQTASAVTYKAPASIATASTATVTATSAFDNTKTNTLTINLVPPPSVTTASLPSGTVAAAYTTTTLAATGGVTPYAWSTTSGALPGGLTLSAAGAVSGTPTAFGTFNFTVQVKDAYNFTATANLSIKINPAPVTITTTALPNGVINIPGYSATLAATGGAPPITWTWAAQAGSTLPAGLVLASNGAISGTPTAAGAFNVTVTASDSSTPALKASKNLSVTIIPQLAITTNSLSNGITTKSYSASLTSTGGSGAVNWSVTAGSLPPGLSLNGGTGVISGTPTTSGNYSFTVQAADSGTPQQKVTKALAISIAGVLSITPTFLPTGAVNSTYGASLSANGGTPPITWSLASGTLPPGVNLTQAANVGTLSGTPSAAGTFNFTIQAVDSGTPTAQTATQSYTVIINPILAVNTSSLANAFVGTAYSQTLQTNGGGTAPVRWSITSGSLPPGLTLAAATGVISGTPTTATGSPFNFTVQAADSSSPQQTASKALSIAVASAPLSVATTGLPNGVVGQAYTGAQLQSAGGIPPVTWSISAGSLPSWASLNTTTGAITGTPTAAGTTTFTVQATDSSTPTAQTATKQLSITVVNALSITTSSLPGGTVGSAYSSTVAATGGTTPYSWSWSPQTGSSLPPGLGINSSTGVISGTPTTNSGSPFNVTVTVNDASNPQQSVSANFSISITVATLTVTTTSNQLPSGTVNAAYPSNVNLSGSGGIPPYTWSQTGGTLPPGLTLSSSGQISGTPTSATGSPFSFTVKVADSATPVANTATATLSITVTLAPTCVSGGSESLLNGQYAFVLKGFDNGLGSGETAPEPALVGGVLSFNGTGTITAGAIDMNLNSGVQTNLSVTSGSYGVTSDHRGCMIITTSAGTQNYRFSLGGITSGVASTGHVIDFDTTGPFTAGVLRKQTTSAFSTSQVTGNYAFGASSIQNSASCNNSVCGGRFGVVGVINFATGTITGGQADINTNGQLDNNSANTTWPSSAGISFNNGGTYTVSSTNGRGTMSFTPSGGSPVTSAIYIVSSTDFLILNTDAQNNNSLFAGEALRQSGTPFTTTPLSGPYIAYQSGISTSVAGAARTTIILLNVSGSSISGNQLRNDAGSFQQQSLSGVTYSSTAEGRMTLTGTGSHAPIFYVVNSGQTFMLSGGGDVDSGVVQSQTGAPFSNSSVSGTYSVGNIDPENTNGGSNVSIAVFASPSINITEDSNDNGSLTVGGTQSFANYSIDSTGLGTIPSSGSTCTISASSTTCQTVFYIISPTKAVVMDTTSSNPKIILADQ